MSKTYSREECIRLHEEWLADPRCVSTFPAYKCDCGHWDNWQPLWKFEPLWGGKGCFVASVPGAVEVSQPTQQLLKQQIWQCTCGKTIAKLCIGRNTYWTDEDDLLDTGP